MAAVIDIHTGLGIADPSHDGTGGRSTRPTPLRVIEGGRSSAGRQMQRTFLRRRVLAAVVVAIVLVLVVQLFGAVAEAFAPGSQGATSAGELLTGASHRVAPGDTLWSIAGRVDPNADPRDVVDELIDLNPGAVSSAGVLRAGQTLVLPVPS